MADIQVRRAWQVWCPLIAVDGHSGCLYLVEWGRHLLNQIRPINSSVPPYQKLLEPLETNYLTRFSLKAGSAVPFDARVLTRVHANRSETLRLVAGCVLLPTGVMTRLYYRDPERPDKL